jgi:alpha-beta hydrolase superfamily lysophospholipase
MNWKPAILRLLARILAVVLLVWLTILLLHGFQSRQKEDLQLYHTVTLKSEFRARDAHEEYTFADYLENEARVFAELQAKVLDRITLTDHSLLSRFHPDSPCHPSRLGSQYNQTIEKRPAEMKGGVLLVHGLTDSPYSMRYLAEMFYEKGYYVVSLRVPGHGTIPAGLTTARWQDWLAAVKLCARHISDTVGPDRPLVLAGYSNGGALALLYTLYALDDGRLPRPAKLLLFLPAIAVSKFAALASQLKALSVIGYFEKAKWNSITPEYDPFKYNSFPLQAASQSYELAKAIEASVTSLVSSEQWKTLGPIITFQSLVDSTVSVPALIDFYAKLKGTGHELVLFDVNRAARLDSFLSTHPQQLLDGLENTPALPYHLTLVTNDNPTSLQVISKTRLCMQPQFKEPIRLNVGWPHQIYSLSHIAILFPPTDPLYGTSPDESIDCIHLGNLEMRGERGLLRIPADNLMRLRCNPFYDWMKTRIEAALP